MKFIAHRGNDHHDFRENTKEALNWCLQQPYIDGVELDTRLTKDKKFVIYHNTSIMELGFERHFIANETLEELQKINFGTMEKPYYLNTLEEFLNSVTNDKIILLDIKKEIGDFDEEIEEILKIEKSYAHLNIYLCSFCHQIEKLSTIMCKFPLGLLISDFINKNKDFSPFQFLSVSKGAFPDIHSPKKKMVWTVNKKKQIKASYEDFYIITDNAYKFVSE